jgi:NADPH:quinone reductase-like Zn-dependent oxidoreductase
MRAATIRGYGALDQIRVEDVSRPPLGSLDVRVGLRAAGLNHLDLFVVQGLPGVTHRFPHVLGADGAGVVADVGEGVSEWQEGDRVIINPGISCHACEFCRAGEHSLCVRFRLLGEHMHGTLAEEIVVPAGNLAVLPAERSWAEGAAFSLVTLTAWRMLVTRAMLRKGEWVLIWGVGGGVSLAALRIAKLLGAVVVVTSSSDEKLARARALGADHTLNHESVPVAQEVRRITGKRGVHVVVDNVGAATWGDSLGALGKGGRLVTCGATTGASVVSDVRRVFWNHYTIMGSTMGNAEEYTAISERLAAGQLVPTVDSVFPLHRVKDAFGRLQRAEQFGKVIVDIRASDEELPKQS